VIGLFNLNHYYWCLTLDDNVNRVLNENITHCDTDFNWSFCDRLW
jgi:hypothetical protein